MKGVILAAGKGSRISELKLQHKSFAPINKKRLIDFSLDLLCDFNGKKLVDEIIIVVGYNADVIVNALKNEYKGVPIKYVYQDVLKGVAHAMMCAKHAINDDCIMCLADEILLEPKLDEMIEEFCTQRIGCVCGCVYDSNDFSGKPIGYDVDDNNYILGVHEKPTSYNNKIRGIGECIFSKEALDYLDILKPNETRHEYEMGDWIQLISNSSLRGKVFRLASAYVNINYAKDIIDAEKMLS